MRSIKAGPASVLPVLFLLLASTAVPLVIGSHAKNPKLSQSSSDYSGKVGPVAFSSSGGSLIGKSTFGSQIFIYLAIPAGSPITVIASADANPLCCNAGYGGVSSTLSVELLNQGASGDTTKSQAGNGTATSVSNSVDASNPGIYEVIATIDFETNCGSLRGCPNEWQPALFRLYFEVKPAVTLESNATGGGVGIPGTVRFSGKSLPEFSLNNISFYRNGVFQFARSPTPNAVGQFDDNETFSTPDQAGSYRVVATASNVPSPFTGNASVVAIMTTQAELTLTVGGGGAGTTTSSTVPQGQQAPFTGTLYDPLHRPIRGAQVQLFWNGDRSTDWALFLPISPVYFTDVNGQFLMNDPRINSSMKGWGFIDVTLATDYFRVEDNTTFSGNMASTRSAEFDLPGDFMQVSSAADLTRTFVLANTAAQQWQTAVPGLGDYSHMGGLAVVYVNMFNAISFYSDNLNLNAFSRYQVTVVAYAAGHTAFHPDDQSPFIVINTKDSVLLNDIPNREYHEFGHYIMFLYFGGTAYFSITNDKNHGGFVNLNSNDGWIEGFAEFFAQATYNYAHGITDPNNFNALYTISNTYVRNMNNVEVVNATFADGRTYRNNAEEHALSNILWALYSGTDNVDGKTTEMSIKSIWTLVTGKYQLCPSLNQEPGSCATPLVTRHIESITDLYLVLTASDQTGQYGLSVAQINKIFLAFKVLEPRADGSIAIGVDDPSPAPTPTGQYRPGRHDDSPLNGSAIVINSDPSSLPYLLTIRIVYQQPFQQDSYSVSTNITQQHQTINLWLPSSKLYNATAVITGSKSGAADVQIASVNNVFYDKNLGLTPVLVTAKQVSIAASGGIQVTSLFQELPYVLVGVVLVILLVAVATKVRGRRRRRKVQPPIQQTRQGQHLTPAAFAQPLTPAPEKPVTSSRFCTNCGAPAGTGSSFCGNCGRPL